MAKHVVDIGMAISASIGGPPYSNEARFVQMASDSPFSLDLHVGRGANLSAWEGYVIRQVDVNLVLSGTINFTWVAGEFVEVAPTALLQRHRANSAGGPRTGQRTWAYSIPDSSVPLGMIPPGGGTHALNRWAGLALPGGIGNFGGYAGWQARLSVESGTRTTYTLSPKPRWTLTAPDSLGVGQTGQVALQVAYPDGEPVVGLAVRLRVAGQGAAFPGGTLVHAATTDAQGRVQAVLEGVAASTSALVLELVDPRTSPAFFDPPLTAVRPLSGQATSSGGCVIIPSVPAVPGVPPKTTYTDTYDWDAGANSVTRIEGAQEVKWTYGGTGTYVIGLTDEPARVPDPTRIKHGWFVRMDKGDLIASAYEAGRSFGTHYIDNSDELCVRLRGGQANYLINGESQRTVPSTITGEACVATSLFGAGDVLLPTEG